MKILDRRTKVLLFEVPPDRCDPDASVPARLRAAVAWALEKRIRLNGAWLRGADLRNMDLSHTSFGDADLTDVDFEGSDISLCTFTGAVLRRTNFRGAKWGDITLNRIPKYIDYIDLPLDQPVWILDTHMQAGCELHSHEEWRAFTDRDLIRMDGRTGSAFWKRYREPLLAICDLAARGE